MSMGTAARFELQQLPMLLQEAWLLGGECVYVRGEEAQSLETYL